MSKNLSKKFVKKFHQNIRQKVIKKVVKKFVKKIRQKTCQKSHQKIGQKIHQKNLSKCFSDISNAKIAQCCQKIRRHFSNKMILKLKLSKNIFYKKCGPKLIFLNKNFI